MKNLNDLKYTDVVERILAIAVGILFVYSAISKVSNPQSFLENVLNYRLFPFSIAVFTALVIPWVEVLIGIFLIVNKWLYKGATLGALVLSLLFVLIVAYAMIMGLDIECGCFGDNSVKIGLQKLGENFLLLLATLFIYIKSQKS